MTTRLATTLGRMVNNGVALRQGLQAVEIRVTTCRQSTGPRAFVSKQLPAVRLSNPAVRFGVRNAAEGAPASSSLTWASGSDGEEEVVVGGQKEDAVLSSLLAAAGESA
jgi:hypothetical protein